MKELSFNKAILVGTYTKNHLKLFYIRNNFFFNIEDKVLKVLSLSLKEVENNILDILNIIKV